MRQVPVEPIEIKDMIRHDQAAESRVGCYGPRFEELGMQAVWEIPRSGYPVMAGPEWLGHVRAPIQGVIERMMSPRVQDAFKDQIWKIVQWKPEQPKLDWWQQQHSPIPSWRGVLVEGIFLVDDPIPNPEVMSELKYKDVRYILADAISKILAMWLWPSVGAIQDMRRTERVRENVEEACRGLDLAGLSN